MTIMVAAATGSNKHWLEIGLMQHATQLLSAAMHLIYVLSGYVCNT